MKTGEEQSGQAGREVGAMLPRPVRGALERRYGIRTRAAERLEGGDEARVWVVDAGGHRFVVHMSPTWRTTAELDWVHAVATHARRSVPEAIAPLRAGGGRSLVRVGGRLIAVFPFVSGNALERGDHELVLEAARVLARLHCALHDWPGRGRPPPGGHAPSQLRVALPSELEDPELDRWWADVASRDLARGPIHGDFYARNLLCDDGRIVGVVDWNESRVAPYVCELAWAAWELCHDDGHRLHDELALAFIAAYVDAGGPVAASDLPLVRGLMRHALRENVRYLLQLGAAGQETVDEDDVASLCRAFTSLA